MNKTVQCEIDGEVVSRHTTDCVGAKVQMCFGTSTGLVFPHFVPYSYDKTQDGYYIRCEIEPGWSDKIRGDLIFRESIEALKAKLERC